MMRHAGHGTASRQRGGATLIGLMVSLAVVMALMPLAARLYEHYVVRQTARIAGANLAEMSVGLQGLIAAVQNGSQTMPAGPINGADFLKPPSCGGLPGNPPEGYVPCSFGSDFNGPNTLFGGQYTTTFSSTGGSDPFVEFRTSFFPDYPQEPRREALIADRIVNAAGGTLSGDPTGTFASYFANTPRTANDLTNATMNPADPDFGRVLAVVSNAPSQDIYLRVDGTNEMLADLDVGGNDIVDTRDVNVGRNLDVVGESTLQGDVDAQSNVLVGLDIRVNGNSYVGQNSFVGQRLAAGNDILTQERVLAKEEIIGKDVAATNTTLRGGGNPRMSQGLYDMSVFTSTSTTISKPGCSRTGSSGQVFAMVQSIASDDGAPIAGFDIRVTDTGANWHAEAWVNSLNGGWQPTSNHSTVLGTKCS